MKDLGTDVLRPKHDAFKEIGRILLRRRWMVFAPLALGLVTGVLEYRSVPVLMGAPLSGLALGLLLVGLVEYRRPTFACEEDVVQLLSIPVLAIIPNMAAEGEPPPRREPAGRRGA